MTGVHDYLVVMYVPHYFILPDISERAFGDRTHCVQAAEALRAFCIELREKGEWDTSLDPHHMMGRAAKALLSLSAATIQGLAAKGRAIKSFRS